MCDDHACSVCFEKKVCSYSTFEYIASQLRLKSSNEAFSVLTDRLGLLRLRILEMCVFLSVRTGGSAALVNGLRILINDFSL